MKARVIVIASLMMLSGLLGAQNMFGAFKIVTEPQGAIVTIYGTNQYLGTTPTQVFPILMDQYMTYNYGIPGRSFSVQISKAGYNTITQEIFVPYNRSYQMDAVYNPTIFSFYLAPQYIQPPVYYLPPPPPPVYHHRPWYFWNHPRPHQPQWDYNPGYKPPHHGGNNGGHGNGNGGHGNGNGGHNNDNNNGGNGSGSHGGSGRP